MQRPWSAAPRGSSSRASSGRAVVPSDSLGRGSIGPNAGRAAPAWCSPVGEDEKPPARANEQRVAALEERISEMVEEREQRSQQMEQWVRELHRESDARARGVEANGMDELRQMNVDLRAQCEELRKKVLFFERRVSDQQTRTQDLERLLEERSVTFAELEADLRDRLMQREEALRDMERLTREIVPRVPVLERSLDEARLNETQLAQKLAQVTESAEADRYEMNLANGHLNDRNKDLERELKKKTDLSKDLDFKVKEQKLQIAQLERALQRAAAQSSAGDTDRVSTVDTEGRPVSSVEQADTAESNTAAPTVAVDVSEVGTLTARVSELEGLLASEVARSEELKSKLDTAESSARDVDGKLQKSEQTQQALLEQLAKLSPDASAEAQTNPSVLKAPRTCQICDCSFARCACPTAVVQAQQTSSMPISEVRAPEVLRIEPAKQTGAVSEKDLATALVGPCDLEEEVKFLKERLAQRKLAELDPELKVQLESAKNLNVELGQRLALRDRRITALENQLKIGVEDKDCLQELLGEARKEASRLTAENARAQEELALSSPRSPRWSKDSAGTPRTPRSPGSPGRGRLQDGAWNTLQKRVRELGDKLEQREKQLFQITQESTAEISSLTKSLAEVERQRDEFAQEQEQIVLRNEELLGLNQDWELQVKEMALLRATYEQSVKDLKGELKSKKAEMDSLRASAERLEERNEELNSEIEELKDADDHDELRSKVQSLEQEKRTLYKRLDEYECKGVLTKQLLKEGFMVQMRQELGLDKQGRHKQVPTARFAPRLPGQRSESKPRALCAQK